MTPMITLYVGEDRIKYYVYEDMLCKLQSFQTLLQRESKEAPEKSINMPDDDPEAVSALVEWLYHDEYIYDGNLLQDSTMALRAAPENPSDALLEGMFHLEICVVASKYDCGDLFKHAKERFLRLHSKLDDIDMLRLWKARNTIKDIGLALLDLNFYWMRKRVGGLFENHRAELVGTLMEYLELSITLLECCSG